MNAECGMKDALTPDNVGSLFRISHSAFVIHDFERRSKSRVRSIAPGFVVAPVTLANGLLARRVHLADDRGQSSPHSAVSAVAVRQFRGPPALTIGFLARRLLNDDGTRSVFRFSHLLPLSRRPWSRRSAADSIFGVWALSRPRLRLRDARLERFPFLRSVALHGRRVS